MTYEELVFNAKTYATNQADSLAEIYTDVSPEEWEYEYNIAFNHYMKENS